jgi:hypothetical protein
MENIIDPFKDIDLNNLKKNSNSIDESQKNTIKSLAIENKFISKEEPKRKEKVITKTFSLFRNECLVINDSITNYSKMDENYSSASGSDVVRAALYNFSQLDKETQYDIIRKHRGRGR